MESWDQFSARTSANRKERILATVDVFERESLLALDASCDTANKVTVALLRGHYQEPNYCSRERV